VATIDVGMLYKGFHTDTAWSKIVGGTQDSFLRVGQDALQKAIDQARVGNRVGHISKAIEDTVRGAGYSIVKSLVGHGISRSLHEDPQIPGFLHGSIADTRNLAEGMTIAIEVIYAKGSGTVTYDHPDGWTVSTRDRSATAVFEHTIAIGAVGPIVLTKADE